MSDLERFRDHARRMATSNHRDDCGAYVRPPKPDGWYRRPEPRWTRPDPDCSGCVPAPERALWAQLAAEVDTYLAGEQDQGLWDPDLIRDQLHPATTRTGPREDQP